MSQGLNDEEPTKQDIELAIHIATLGLLSMLAEVGAVDTAKVVAMAMAAYATEGESGEAATAKLAKLASSIKEQWLLENIKWPEALH